MGRGGGHGDLVARSTPGTPVSAKVSCPAPGCDYGPNGEVAFLHGRTMKEALRHRDDHLRSAHKGWKPPTGSILSRVPRLD